MSERVTSERVRPSTVLIAAMGGEGGGVLTAWLVNAARKHGLPVQATSIPGVAQRTGATAYYIEVCPVPYAELDGKEPVMDLFPGPGDIDLMVATELVETGRAMEKGFVDPDRTTLIASTHRIFTMSEKMAMGDGRFDSEKIVEGAKKMSKRAILFDMEKAAQDTGSIINSVILGAIAGSGVLPIPAEVFEKGIEEEGKAVKQNLAGFKAGLAYARGEILEARPKKVARPIPVPAAPQLPASAVALKTRIEQTYPASIQPIVLTAAARCFDYQNARYAKLYLDRLDQILEIEKAQNSRDFLMTQETARHLGLRMTFEDLIRVAQLKSRASRLDRVRREVEATPDQVVKVTE
ncbi:MAG: indolepyruvate oxidoreductase subunit beta family protein, partial [Alphaproteobacteria bacterium]